MRRFQELLFFRVETIFIISISSEAAELTSITWTVLFRKVWAKLASQHWYTEQLQYVGLNNRPIGVIASYLIRLGYVFLGFIYMI